MAERTKIAEFNEVASAALTAISHAMEDGEKTGKRIDEWATLPMTLHMLRAESHIDDFKAIGDLVDLEHAICRLVMLLALRKRDGQS